MFWILYLISIADGVKTVLGTFGWIIFSIYMILLVIGIVWALCGQADGDDDMVEGGKNFIKETWKRSFIFLIAILFIFMSVLVPSTKNLLIIFGVSKFTESEIFYQTNETAKKSIMLLNKKLDKYLEDEEVKKEE